LSIQRAVAASVAASKLQHPASDAIADVHNAYSFASSVQILTYVFCRLHLHYGKINIYNIASIFITVVDTVVRAMCVNYKKWRWGVL